MKLMIRVNLYIWLTTCNTTLEEPSPRSEDNNMQRDRLEGQENINRIFEGLYQGSGQYTISDVHDMKHRTRNLLQTE